MTISMTVVPQHGHQSDGQKQKSVESEPCRTGDGDFTALHKDVIDDVNHTVNALDIRTNHSGADVFPFSEVLCIIGRKGRY